MTRHIIGYNFGSGKIGRFEDELSDSEFDAILRDIGGELPEGFLAWHLGDDEHIENSPRARELFKICTVGQERDGRLVLNNIPVAPRPYASAVNELHRAAGILKERS